MGDLDHGFGERQSSAQINPQLLAHGVVELRGHFGLAEFRMAGQKFPPARSVRESRELSEEVLEVAIYLGFRTHAKPASPRRFFRRPRQCPRMNPIEPVATPSLVATS